MTLIGKTSNALFFNGVADGIVVPQAGFERTGLSLPNGARSSGTTTGQNNGFSRSYRRNISRVLNSFSIEAWVAPDHGGVVAVKPDLFELRIGAVGEPAPAEFSIHVRDDKIGKQTVRATSAEPIISGGSRVGWDGLVYPRDNSSFLASGNCLNEDGRELLHIVGTFDGRLAKLYINGELVSSTKLAKQYDLKINENDLYIGGRGGEFRGYIESVHWRRGTTDQIRPEPLLSSTDTIGLWRFEEPIDVDDNDFYIASNVSEAATTINIGADGAKSLYEAVTGKDSSTFTTTLNVATDYGLGNYQVSTPTGLQSLAHTPYNLMINPTICDSKTGQANLSPPERVRLLNIATNGDLTVNSIHLDFDTHATGARGVLHARTAFHTGNNLANDSLVVLVKGDLLVDSGTGAPYRPPGLGSQVIDRTGQMVLDESGNLNHGIIYSRLLSIGKSANPFDAAAWPAALKDQFKEGHTARHKYNQRSGHSFLRVFPPSHEEVVTKTVDGAADSFSVVYDGQSIGLKEQVPINSQVSLHRQAFRGPIKSLVTSSTVTERVESGHTAGGTSAEHKREIIAIGGPNFDVKPFLLKGHAAEAVVATDNVYDLHLAPETESRVAILEVPSLAGVLSVEITSGGSGYGAGTAATTGGTGTGCQVTYTVSAGAINAVTGIAVAGSGYKVGDVITVSGGGGNATLTITAINAVPYVQIHYNAIDLTGGKMGGTGAMLLIEKTVPAGGSVIGGTSVAGHIAAAIGSGLTIHAPGGVVRISKNAAGDSNDSLKPHRLVGDNTGGRQYEIELDESLLPSNHTPTVAGDPGRKPPQGIDSSHSLHPTHPSVYNRIIMRARNRAMPDPPLDIAPTYYRQSPAVDNTNTDGTLDVGATNQSTHIHEVFDIIDNYRDRDDHVLILQPSNRSRIMQLAKAVGEADTGEDPSFVSLEFLQSRGRITSIDSRQGPLGRQIVFDCRGLMDDINVSADLLGDGSPDSHPIKEIAPGAPVVTVTLGGPGQGAVNTKPTFDPSPLSRLGWSTRRDCVARVSVVGAPTAPLSTITVVPLNNNSLAISSWGTYCFPEVGRVYLANGASAGYVSKTTVTFSFTHTPTAGSGTYLNADGSESATYATWIATNKIVPGTEFHLDPLFDDGALCSDGTTGNDRLFQSLRSVNHDYQLGTQYASTRALVEIPLFPYHFFEDRDRGVFPGPDNSLKMVLDATMTAHTWNPNPVGRRCPDYAPADREVMGAYHINWVNNEHIQGTKISRPISPTNYYVYVENANIFPDSSDLSTGTGEVREMDNSLRQRRAYLPNGEWCAYRNDPAVDGYLHIDILGGVTNGMSKNFLKHAEVGVRISVGGPFENDSIPIIGDDPHSNSTKREFRRPYYYDRANIQTQGGNVDYGLRQYVSAVEFKAGPQENPHLPRIKSGGQRFTITARPSGTLYYVSTGMDELTDQLLFMPPIQAIRTGVALAGNRDGAEEIAFSAMHEHGATYHYTCVNEGTGRIYYMEVDMTAATHNSAPEVTILPHPIYDSGAPTPLTTGTKMVIRSIDTIDATVFPRKIDDGLCNATWNNPYAPGGLRQGDTVWMNMQYTNPHAVEGVFSKSRGVLNEFEVWSGFNGGRTNAGIEARDTVYMENFLIGDDCLTTARNYAQHVNKTIELNWTNLGRSDAAPVVAFVDPYLSTQEHARVLLYDVAHDREAVCFQDLWMQVQSSQREMRIKDLDVANGFRTQRRDRNPAKNLTVTSVTDIGGSSPAGNDVMMGIDGKSEFMESAYSHYSWYYINSAFNTKYSLNAPVVSKRQVPNYLTINDDESGPCPTPGSIDRTENSVCCPSSADDRHARSFIKAATDTGATAAAATLVWTNHATAYPLQSTFFDTPEGTRCIPAFLALKGKRSSTLDLSNHTEARLKHLSHWTQMDFVRRLKLDLGEVGVKEGVTDIEAAAREVVRLVNQAGALNGRSSQRRPADQYPGESDKFDITKQSTNRAANSPASSQISDPTAPHHKADFAVTGSTHDPAPFWDDTAFSSFDRGSHMGYMRAHVGRVVEDVDGVEGFTIVIHSTVPGASGRNFCVWLDNSKAQAPYRPQFLVGHGGRFRNFWCQPEELLGENMHPAPMPINKQGRPFAPITTLREYLPPDETGDEYSNNLHLGHANQFNGTPGTGSVISEAGTLNNEVPSGRSSNTYYSESFESQQENRTLIEGLRIGSRARARINFGGIVASGVPGWCPEAGRWGFGVENTNNSRYNTVYGRSAGAVDGYSAYVGNSDKNDEMGDTPIYGIRLVDHLGRRHTVRLLYRQYGQTFANDNTKLPASIDNEILVWFDDRDVGQGGFTLGKNMAGTGDPAGRITTGYTGAAQTWKGNEFRGAHIPEGGYAVSIDQPSSDTVLSLRTGDGYYNDGIWHDLPDNVDVLGYLGFPDSGMIWVAHPAGGGAAATQKTIDTIGHVFHYTHRTHNSRGTDHTFFGISGESLTTLFNAADECGPTAISGAATAAYAPVIISPTLNQTTLVTDELIAAAIERAMTIDPNSDNLKETSFDCTDMFAPDGRTFGEWGVSPTAIRVRAFSEEHEVIPLRNLFEVDRQPDWGIYAGCLDSDAVGSHTHGGSAILNDDLGGLSIADIKLGKRLDVGYLPETVLHVTTKYRGTNANTATPVLIDSHDNIVNTDVWRDNLRGLRYTRFVGDHITPAVENPMFEIEDNLARGPSQTSVAGRWELYLKEQPSASAADPGMSLFWLSPVGRYGYDISAPGTHTGALDFTHGGHTATDLSFAPLVRVWYNDENSFVCEPLAAQDAGGSSFHHIALVDDRTGIYDKNPTGTVTTTNLMAELLPGPGGTHSTTNALLSKWAETDRSRLFCGARLSGSPYGEPFTYFRGARDSPDHSVPLYFGGGFSGVVLDINDGSKNDYSSFYSHPYSTGPTGTAGIQHANELFGSHAIIDTAAMLAMFPGTAMLDQHKGEISPPFANQQMILTPDMDGQANDSKHSSTGLNTMAYGNVDVTRPSPLIMRFAKPNARYSDTPQATPPQTTYVIFGPGQSFPKHWASEAAETSVEPSVKFSLAGIHGTAGCIGVAYDTNTGPWSPIHITTRTGAYHPNEISHGNATSWGGKTRAGTDQYLPPVRAFTADNVGAFKAFVNWETAHGFPNSNYNNDDEGNVLYSGDHFAGTTGTAAVGYAHPFYDFTKFATGLPVHSTEIMANIVWHMDGGYPSGGHFFDNCIRMNPVHPVTGNVVASRQLGVGSTTKIGNNATIYRGCAQLATAYDLNINLDEGTESDIMVVDATRVQNAEEFATVIASAINTYPGSGALKALGGTFAPTFGNSHQQDRYGWVEVGTMTEYSTTGDPITSGFVRTAYIPESVPAYGYIRVVDASPQGGSTDRGFYGLYYGVHIDHPGGSSNYAFLLHNNRKSQLCALEDPTVTGASAAIASGSFPSGSGSGYKVYVWAKTGNLRWSNGAQDALQTAGSYGDFTATRTNTVFAHLAATQVHFNGAVNAVDRTRPIGGIGWAGERYSYLNSLPLVNPNASKAIGTGKGAWHSMLGFSPYGAPNSCHSKSGSLVGIDKDGDDLIQFHAASDCPHGVHPRHYVVVGYESELPLVAKFDRDGVSCTGDLLAYKWGASGAGTAAQMGTSMWSADLHNPDRYTAPANGGPNIEALWADGADPPATTGDTVNTWNDAVTQGNDLYQMGPCLFPTGDLFFDTDINPGALFYADNALQGMSTTALKRTCAGAGGAAGKVKTVSITAGGTGYSAGSGVATTGGSGAGLTVTYTVSGGAINAVTAIAAGGAGYKVNDVVTVSGGDGNATLKVTSIYVESSADVSPYKFWESLSAAWNFSTQHAVWKRMDGGNLSLPASNARGLGAIPFITRVKAGAAVATGEKLLGNNRFSFETTNAAMYPIIQAQELSHPQVAELFPFEVRNVLEIPNEELQFGRMKVTDDTGQEHIIEGGSPFGTIIRDFDLVSDREVEGLAPAEAGSGNSPNMRIRLPDPDTIPGNIVVRSGFDRLQAYQNESIGTGGLQRPGDAEDLVKRSFDNTNPGPRVWPTWENNAWDNIDTDPDNFPDNTPSGWRRATGDAPLRTTYEPHDRALYFHVTKVGHTHTEREPALYHTHNFAGSSIDVGVTSNPLTVGSVTATTIVCDGAETIDERIWKATSEQSSGRWFLSINGQIASYTGVSLPRTFTGVVFSPGFSATAGNSIKPSFFMPAGSNRFFAARRMRDHCEVSGESPDMPLTKWYNIAGARGGTQTPAQLLKAGTLTPMPIPRMGHHFVTPTMALLPGHFAHPLYQRLYTNHYACGTAAHPTKEAALSGLTTTKLADALKEIPVRDPVLWFSSLTANYPPSDIHGGAFSLMVETKVRYDGYGILASDGVAGEQNSKGGHRIYLEAAKDYTLSSHFPDPLEVGAYQIVIQPNIYSQQLVGYHYNPDAVSDAAPFNPATNAFVTRKPFLTGQQVVTVIGIDDDSAQANGAFGLILASAVAADVRGCEVYMNEVMLDIDPAPGQQFATLPPLATHNALGVNQSSSPPFTRRSLPYHPGMFRRSTPGYTLTIPWWASTLKDPFGIATASPWKRLEHYPPDDYYHFCRSTLGAISSQITLAGYPTHFYDAYTGDYSALSPVCTVISVTSGSNLVVVDNNDLFPLVGSDYYNMMLELEARDGRKLFASYNRRGYTSGGGAGLGTENTSRFEGVVPQDATFWAEAVVGAKIRLTGAYQNYDAGEVYTESKLSVATRNLPQLLHGTRDTNSLHMADAYLVKWHPNLGRPYTFHSDSSRANPDSPAFLQQPLNHLPEYFETIHYHEFAYAVSNGPFGLRMQATSTNPGTGAPVNPESLHSDTPAEGGTDGVAFHLSNYWPGGTRYGAHATRLDFWGDIFRGWGDQDLQMGNCKAWVATGTVTALSVTAGGSGYTGASGVATTGGTGSGLTVNTTVGAGAVTGAAINAAGTGYVKGDVVTVSGGGGNATLTITAIDAHATTVGQSTVAAVYAASNTTYAYHRNYCFGHRFAVRQPYNRPRWAITVAKGIGEAFDFPHGGYQHGPIVQHDIGSWTYEGEGGLADQAITATNTGILERMTNASALLGPDVRGHQVRYADGRRMTRPFGCPVRNIVNPITAKRMHPGDFFVGKNSIMSTDKRNLAPAVMFYIVDWWGNTTGEEVRKFPVRGFGVRPSWDPEESYALQTNNPTTALLYRDRSHFTLPSAAEGVDNRTNRGTGSEDLVDWFNPAKSMRIGSRSDGRGCRWPTAFNENVLQAVSIPIRPIGMVLSHHTAEPPFTTGLLRPTNSAITDTDIPVGISRRLSLNKADGLLKPEAMSGQNVEQAEADFLSGGAFIQEAISRIAPRIGLDTMTVGEATGDADRSYMIQGTQATSLHTDRSVGQRYIVAADYDLTSLDFSTDTDDIMKLSLTDGINPLGGSYILDLGNYMEPVSDANWGASPAMVSGMVLWLKADSLDLVDGAAVTQWDDVSGNGHSFVQGTASAQPTYRASDSDFNNMPVVDCDGNDKLVMAAFEASLNTNQITLFAVAASDTDNNSYQGIISSRSSVPVARAGFNIYAKWSGSDRWQFWWGKDSAWGSLTSTTALALNRADIITAQISGGNGAGAVATQVLRVNGAQEATVSEAFWKSTGAVAASAGNVPTSYYLDGQIAEVIQYNRALTTAEIMQVESYLAVKYGKTMATTWRTSNPYQTNDHYPFSGRTNTSDKTLRLLLRPVRVLDQRYLEIFRHARRVAGSSPQDTKNYYTATAGGRYGLFVYDAPGARVEDYILTSAPSPTNPPYAPVYYVDPAVSVTAPISTGPFIPGAQSAGFQQSLRQTVARVIVSANTLQHYRSDAPRRQATVTDDDDVVVRPDYTVQPRYSQSTHPGTKFNTDDHSGEVSANYSEVNN